MGEEIIREDDDYITTLSINRPEKRNALNADADALFSVTLHNNLI
jgi:enoyl-CoA hydratase/carnithine racemase